MLRALRTTEWKLIDANPGNPRGLPPEELFQVSADPGETQNVAPERAALAGEMRAQAEAKQQLARSKAAGGEAAKITETQQEALKALGYAQ